MFKHLIRGPVAVSLIASLLLASGCVLPGDDSGLGLPPCDCPNLIQVVESIDWVPGVEGQQRDASASDDLTSRGVVYEFDVADPETEVQRLKAKFEAQGIAIELDNAVQGFRVTGSAGYGVLASISHGKLRISVALLEGVPDEQAKEVLQPVVQAIGLQG